MTVEPRLTAEQEAELNQILTDYLDRVDQGTAEPRAEFLERWASYREQLTDFFSQSDQAETLIVRASDTMVGTLQIPAGARRATPPPPPPPPPAKKSEAEVTSFGDYDLLQQIARGGMGVVYKAKQRKLNRIVAIKMILSGRFADDDELHRFYAEAEAAANLRHPNIVGIHEVGEHDGQHFFSMEYVDGQSLGDLVRENALEPRHAAELVVTISDAMHYAHEQGILHRDIKPSNILLDTNQQPMITDFGLAKQVEGQSQLTMSGMIMGTPSYMPPEQAAGQNERVDRRSDVYSLGAVLYELVTGKPPFRAATPFETIRQVLEIEPVAPRLLNPSIPVDLETLCLKCLQKDAAKRYESAADLSAELSRFLRGEPILARRVSRTERTWRWCRRNPVVASLLGLAAALFLVTFVAIVYAYVSTSKSLDVTNKALAEAEFNYQQARRAADELFTEVSQNTLLNEPGMKLLRRQLLSKALEYYKSFLAQRGQDKMIDEELGKTYFRVAYIMEQTGSPEEALTYYHEAVSLQKQLLTAQPRSISRLEALSSTYSALGPMLFTDLQRFDEARQAFESAITLRRQLVLLKPEDFEFQRILANSIMNWGVALVSQNQFEEARQQEHEAQRLRSDLLARVSDSEHANQQANTLAIRVDLAKGYYMLADLELAAGNLDAAEPYTQQAIDAFESIRSPDDPNLENENSLALAYLQQGLERGSRLYQVLSDDPANAESAKQAAISSLDKAFEVVDPLAKANPEDHRFQNARAKIYLSRAQVHYDAGDLQEAESDFESSLKIQEPLSRRFPDSTAYIADFTNLTLLLIKVRYVNGNIELALRDIARVEDYFTTLGQSPLAPSKTIQQNYRDHVWIDLEETFAWQLESLRGDPATTETTRLRQVELLILLAAIYDASGRQELAIEPRQQAYQLLDQEAAANSDNSRGQFLRGLVPGLAESPAEL